MFFGKKRNREIAEKEAEIQAIRQDTLDSIDKAAESTNKVNKLLGDKKLGITEMIFYATGGNHRK